MNFTDALGYYLRDVYDPFYARYQAGQWPEPADSVIVDEAYAVRRLRDTMTEVMGWDPEAVESMIPVVQWDEAYHMWTVSGEVSAESMEKATDLRRDMDPVLEGKNIEKTETGYRCTVLVDEKGRIWRKDLDKEAFRREYQDEVIPVEKISVKQAMELAEAAVKEKYRPDESAWKEVFADMADAGTGEENGRLNLVVFHNHYYRYFARDYLYGVLVNMATGKVEAAVDYREENQGPEWQLLTCAARTEQSEGWYAHWKPESKQAFIEKIRACGLLPEHAFWQLARPSEAETDAFVAELFGAEGHLSLVNVKVMLHTLMGEEKAWDPETKLLADRMLRRYGISSEDLREQQETASAEISAAEAERIIRAAVCEAWEMPADALDKWTAVTRQVEDRVIEDITRPDPTKVNMVYYRVFLTRPDEEVGQDTFGGLDNFNYRVAMDGTVLTTERHPGWYSPKKKRERWSK